MSAAEPTIDGTGMTLVVWGWDCIDCQGDFGANDRCDSCAGTNRIPLYATEADAARFEAGGKTPTYGPVVVTGLGAFDNTVIQPGYPRPPLR